MHSGPAEGDRVIPVPPSERLDIIDIVRGFALFGVLIANMMWTSQWFAVSDVQREAIATSGIDELFAGLVLMFVDYKFYTLFSILFGLGFAIQMSRAEARGQSVVPTFARRLIILLVLGVAHGLLLWFGDVLHTYALLGFVLILFRKTSDHVLFRWMVGVAACAIVAAPWMQWLTGGLGMQDLSNAEWLALANERYVLMTSGDWRDVVALNWSVASTYYTEALQGVGGEGTVVWYLNVLWKFLLGFFVGRRVFRPGAVVDPKLVERAFPWLLTFGLIGNLYLALSPALFNTWIPSEHSVLVLTWTVVELGIVSLSLAYVCGLVQMYRSPRFRRVVLLLAPVGRMALTNYLTHSVCIVLIYYGVGAGMLGRVGASGCVLICVLIFGVQIVFSRWWLSRLRFGPMEWVWRCLTYGRVQALVRVAE